MTKHDEVASEEAVKEVERLGEALFSFWARTEFLAASMLGCATQRIGSPLQSDSDETSTEARRWLLRLDAVDEGRLPRSAELTRRFIRFELSKLVEAADLHRFDLQLTPYRIGMTLAEVHRFAQLFVFRQAADLERYCDILQQYSRFLAGSLQNLREQVRQGIAVPESVRPACVQTLQALAVSCERYLQVWPERLSRIQQPCHGRFQKEVERVITEVRQRFFELCGGLQTEGGRGAPLSGGLLHYPGGAQAYEMLIRHHTTLPMSADEAHRRGLELVRETEEEMARLRGQLGFRGSGRAFLARIREDPCFYCATPEALGDLYLRLMRKAEGMLSAAFGRQSFPPYGLKRLPAEAEGGLTFGYYQPPDVGGGEIGSYLYNASNLAQRLTIGAASLIYHELIPGHHLHLATEMGNIDRPMVRRYPTITAFNEGWAEYAADLGFEFGLYEDPYHRYGRYLMQMLMASRLVVDSGLNACGWSFERARGYLLEHTAQSANEVDSEVARYATAIPGQALAYAIGRKHFWGARRLAVARLGTRFNLPDFHRAVLDAGSLPLKDMLFGVESWIDATLKS